MKAAFAFVILSLVAITSVIVYVQTDGLKGCPLRVGDRVVGGMVVAKTSRGSLTPNCRVAIKYNDGSVSEKYEYAWKFKKQEPAQ